MPSNSFAAARKSNDCARPTAGISRRENRNSGRKISGHRNRRIGTRFFSTPTHTGANLRRNETIDVMTIQSSPPTVGIWRLPFHLTVCDIFLFMKNVLAEFRDAAQSSDTLLPMIEVLWSEWLDCQEDDGWQHVRQSPGINLLLRQLGQANVKWMDYYCESPIERTMIGALLCLHAKWLPISLIIAPNFLHGPDPIQCFREVCADTENFVEQMKDGSNSPVVFLERIKECAEKKVIMDVTFDYMRDHYLFYNLFPLRSAFHLNLQPEMKHIRVAGRTIRPDLLFWTLDDPKFRLVVECDGFDYHSDRDAFTRDRQRDRVLRVGGFDVGRFSGSEIHRDPPAVAEELFQIMRQIRFGPPESNKTS